MNSTDRIRAQRAARAAQADPGQLVAANPVLASYGHPAPLGGGDMHPMPFGLPSGGGVPPSVGGAPPAMGGPVERPPSGLAGVHPMGGGPGPIAGGMPGAPMGGAPMPGRPLMGGTTGPGTMAPGAMMMNQAGSMGGAGFGGGGFGGVKPMKSTAGTRGIGSRFGMR